MKRRLAAILAADMVSYSKLMERDAESVLSRQKEHRKTLIDPAIVGGGGTIIKTTGDGMLAAFETVQDAVRAAIDIQAEMAEREGSRDDDARIQYRIGINVGDAIFDDGDVFGDVVNVAARLESLAEPGAVCVSDAAYQILPNAMLDRFFDLGSQNVKNISRPIKVWQWSPAARDDVAEPSDAALAQRISFCIAPDGTQLAYATVGEGASVMKAPNWLNHLEYDWRSPVWGPMLSEMARDHRLVRFDQRANGLSDWEVETISEDAMISDMTTVVDAAGLEDFALFGISQGCSFSIRYAVENPEKVRCLVLLNGFARGALHRGSKEQTSLHHATTTMIRDGWGSPNPVYRNVFTDSMMADAPVELKKSYDELQRIATSADNAARINEMNAEIDVTDLARRVEAPTLVLHCEGDRRVPTEEGRRMAALIPGARFVGLPGNNHVLLGGTEAFDVFFKEYRQFLAEHG
jgi:class 3 adenylate cyclase/pimeloyl-ACP methyl ester carboxylesterase